MNATDTQPTPHLSPAFIAWRTRHAEVVIAQHVERAMRDYRISRALSAVEARLAS